MPNGGSLPDCMHCISMKRASESWHGARCIRHDFILPWPLYVFCSAWTESHPDGEGWLDELLDRSLLQQDQMYLWFLAHVRFPDGSTGAHREHELLAPIEDFKNWTTDEFLESLDRSSAQKRVELHRKGIEPI